MSVPLFWLTQNSSDLPDDENWLSGGERDILAGLRFPKRRNDWLLGRWTAKRAICAYQSRKDAILSSLEIRAAADGAPEVFCDGEAGGISLSISHSEDQGFCAVSLPGCSIGCDLERMVAHEDPFTEDYFTPEEIAFCKNAPAENALIVNLVWSAKESMLKALRQGLRRDTRSVRIHPDLPGPEGSWNTWTGLCLESSRNFWGWWRSCNGYIYTLASDRLTPPPEQLSV